MVDFLCFLYSRESGTRTKMWNLVVIFFYWHANSGFSQSLCSCCVFLIPFTFFYTQSSLVKGLLEVSYYLYYSLFLYLHKSGIRSSFICLTLVSKISHILISIHFFISTGLAQGYSKALHYFSLSLLFYFHEFGTRLFKVLHYVRLHFTFLLIHPTTWNMVFSASPLWVIWHKVRALSAWNPVTASCSSAAVCLFLLLPIYINLHLRVRTGKPKKIWIFS